MLNTLYYLSLTILVITALKILFLVLCSSLHNKQNKKLKSDIHYKPLLTVLVPCFNEEKTVNNCLIALLTQTYSYFEAIVINDGSTDNTLQVASDFCNKFQNFSLINKPNSGKAGSLNSGIKKAKGSIIVVVDADSILHPDSLQQIVNSFKDPKIQALGGNVKVINRNSLLTKHQGLEYISGLHLQRKAFAYLGCSQVVPSAIGAFRKKALLKANLYSTDTLVEDMDITIKIAKSGGRVDFNPKAISYTEAPTTFSNLAKQRLRWAYGMFQVIAKHNQILFNKNFGTLGLIGLPYVAVFSLLDILVSLLFFATLLQAVISGEYFALLITFSFFALVQIMLSFYCLKTDNEKPSLALLSVFDYIWYNHLLAFFVSTSLLKFVFKRKVVWTKIPRLGTCSLSAIS